MKYLSNVVKVVAMVLLLSVNSCQQSVNDMTPQLNSARSGDVTDWSMSTDLEDVSVNGEVESRGGILHFKNLKSFITIEKKLQRAHNKDEKKALLNSSDFKSLEQALYDAYEPLRDSTKSVSINDVLALNKDILQITNGELNAKGALRHQHVVNRKGLVYIGKVLYRFTEDGEIIVSDGDIKKAMATDAPLSITESKLNVTKSKSANARLAAQCPSFYGLRWNGDGRRTIEYGVNFYADKYLTSGTVGQPDARYNVSHTTYNRGLPGKTSSPFSYNRSRYNTDNHFFPNYRLYYASTFTNYTTQNIVATSGSELFNYGSSIDFTYTVYSASNVDESQANAYHVASLEGGIDAFGNDASQYGYYYSSGVPTPIYMKCD